MAKAKVFLVEDDPAQADVTSEMLRKSGYDVVCAKAIALCAAGGVT